MQLFKFRGGKQLEYYVICVFVVISYQFEMKSMSSTSLRNIWALCCHNNKHVCWKMLPTFQNECLLMISIYCLKRGQRAHTWKLPEHCRVTQHY